MKQEMKYAGMYEPGLKHWAHLTNEQQRIAIARIERGLMVMEPACKLGNITAPQMDAWYHIRVYSDGSMSVEHSAHRFLAL